MLVRFCTLLLASLAYATPVIEVRTVTSLNQAAFEEAQQRDNTATRAFSSIEIKVTSLFVQGECELMIRHPMAGVYSSTNCPVISARI